MASTTNTGLTISRKRPAESPYQLDPDQTLKASQALLRHVKAETQRIKNSSSKTNLLSADTSDSDDETGAENSNSVWLTLTTKQHIVDKTRLKPSKIAVPHSLNTSTDLRICLITTDPQRAVKNVVADPAFPENLKSRITRIISVTKLKARYKTFETRRQLLSEHDVFLADDRIITRLPALLGKVFYKSTSKRPIPIVVAKSERTKSEEKPQKKSKDQGPGSPKSPVNLAKEIEKAVDCVPVSLRPGTLLAVRVGLATFTPEQLSANVAAVVTNVIERHVVKGWRNVRGIHIKGHSTFAIPLWLAEDLWTDVKDVKSLEASQDHKDQGEIEASPGQKRKRNPNTSKGPQAGSRKKTKVDETKNVQSETVQALKEGRKRELRDLNLRVWTGAQDVYLVANSLDSSLKKNTAFIKRLRTGISPTAQDTFLSETRALSLQKYLSEIVSATYEGLTRLKTASEVSTGVEVVSALHQRFGPADFTKKLAWLLGKGLTPPDKAQVKQWTPEVREREEKERLVRQRILLRVVSEFWLCGILRNLDDVDRPDDTAVRGKDSSSQVETKTRPPTSGGKSETLDQEPFPLEVLKELLGHDPEHINLSLAVLFVKNFSWDVLGLKPPSDESRKIPENDGIAPEARTSGEQDALSEDDEPIISPPLRQRFVNVFERYLASVKSHVIRDQKSLNNQSRRNAEAYVKSGEVFEDRQANFERQTKAQDKLVANAQVLCDVLGQEMPELNDKDGSEVTAIGTVGMIKTGDFLKGQGDGSGIWEDEDERRFYENLVDLKGRVPGILLEDVKKPKPEVDDRSEGNLTSEAQKSASELDDQSTAIANKTVGAQVDAILVRLPDVQTKDMVDQVALDFCFVNSKASRNRLVKAIQEIPKGRTDLLPLYARLAATLGQYMPDVVQGLIAHLDEEFRSLQRRKTKDFLGQIRMTNIRYLAELTKFGVVPEHVIFHCFKVSLDDFSRMNIEIIAHLLENCGRYLLRNPDTAPRMASFLETLNRKKTAQHLGSQERMLVENAMYYVDPPQRASIQQKERTPTELFIRQLVYMEMTKRNYMKILKTIRKLHWEENEVVRILEKVFSKPGKVKFSNIHLLAVLLQALSRYHQEFAIGTIDNMLEYITLGIEQNDFKFNQRRLAEVKYLGELYNYKMVDSTVIFDTLYRIVTFGHEGGTPQPDSYNPLDLPDDFFRIRLVCTILDTCGICFDRGSSKKKLDFFLTFFQYYMLTKDPLPMEIEFLVQDTYSLVRPNWKLVTDFSESARLFAEAVSANYKLQAGEKASGQTEELEDSGSEDGLGDGEVDLDPVVARSSDDEGEAEVDEDTVEERDDNDSDEEEQIIVMRPEEQFDPEAEADFDRAFEKMMAESLDSRKFERKAQFDVPLPIRKVQRTPLEPVEDEPIPPIESEPNTMAFSLMTKKGNRQQTRTIDLPSDSSFAVSMKSQQAAEREEQQRIKNLVLNYDLHEDDQTDGTSYGSPCGSALQSPLERNPNTKGLKLGHDHFGHSLNRAERFSRNQPRARRLNLSDVDWYGNTREASQAVEANSKETVRDSSSPLIITKKPG